MYGPPGTGKTLLARACAAQTDATFLKLAGPQLVQMFIGDGAKLVRDCFALAKEKAPAIIFIDELDAVGTKRFDSEKSGDREVQRTMLELLNQLDGFASDDRIKVLAATNRVDVLDPALLRSGRLDRKIEFPLPNEEARAQILKIHSRKMKVDPTVNWGELARSTDEFGGAMLKAVCVEAGMIALRMGKNKISHEHYVDAIAEVQAKKKDVSKNRKTLQATSIRFPFRCCFLHSSGYSRANQAGILRLSTSMRNLGRRFIGPRFALGTLGCEITRCNITVTLFFLSLLDQIMLLYHGARRSISSLPRPPLLSTYFISASPVNALSRRAVHETNWIALRAILKSLDRYESSGCPS